MRLPPAAVMEAKVLAMPAVRERVRAIATEVEVEAHELAAQRAWDTGEYGATIRAQPADPITGVVTVKATDRKSKWLEEGTGIYGPQRRPITPVRAKFLVFQMRKAGSAPLGAMSGKVSKSGLIFAKSVKGRRASWVMRDAASSVAARHGFRFVNRRSFQG